MFFLITDISVKYMIRRNFIFLPELEDERCLGQVLSVIIIMSELFFYADCKKKDAPLRCIEKSVLKELAVEREPCFFVILL